jgi:type VI secretion system protein ImpF
LARVRTETLITQTLIDRFILSQDRWPKTRKESVDKYREGIRRDLEWMLNTRQPVMPILSELPETAKSVFNYGFPDLHTFDNSGKNPETVSGALERCIRTFEPRIEQAKVFLTRADTSARSLKFHIEGVIRYEDTHEDVKFDTVLEIISGEYEVV